MTLSYRLKRVGGSDLSLEEPSISLKEIQVEIDLLNMKYVNFDEWVYVNNIPDMRYWAKRIKEESVVLELEIFEWRMENNLLTMTEEEYLASFTIRIWIFGRFSWCLIRKL